MKISITFKNINSSDALKSHIHKKFDRLDKMLDNPAEAQVVLSVEKLWHIADINLNCGKIKIHAKEEVESNMYSAIDTLSGVSLTVIDKITQAGKIHIAI